MPQGLQALVALLVLLPGFVSARIVHIMSAKSQQTELERIIEALIFSFFTYVCYIAIFGASLPFDWSSTSMATHSVGPVYRWHLIALVAIAVFLGFSWGYVRGHDLLLKLLGRCRLTQRSSRDSVWTDVFMNFRGTVQVGLGDGRSVIGWLRQYAESNDERTLFLERATWIADGSDPVEIPGDGLLLFTEKSDIKYVMFLDKGQV